MDLSAGDFFVRAGRQILVWGETDAFRLLDYINPIDSSFGGFLISLDERRVPLDMIRASYRIGERELGAKTQAEVDRPGVEIEVHEKYPVLGLAGQ